MVTADVIVVGVGGMGSSACYYLAKQKANVIGIEQFSLCHSLGSSHGETRMIRKAYFEHPNYVPLLKRAYKLWDDLGIEWNCKLLHRTGVIYFGPPQGEVISGVLSSAKTHQLDVQKWNRKAALNRFPYLIPPQDYNAVWEPDAGYLEVDECVKAQVNLAKAAGAVFRENEKVLKWKQCGGTIKLNTNKNSYSARSLIFTSGAWRLENIDLLRVLRVHRQVVSWFPSDENYSKENKAPCFAFDLPYGFLYGFPNLNNSGVKIANHTPGELVANPSNVLRELKPSDLIQPQAFISECLPGVKTEPIRSSFCLYTMSPDTHFIIDRHPRATGVFIAAGFSGHGFKFASVFGEVLGQLALEGKSTHSISFLSLERFTRQ